MAAMTDLLENRLIDWFFRGASLNITGASAGAGTGPATLWVGLFTATPTEAGGGTEVSGGSYARASVTSNTTNWASTVAATNTGPSTGSSGTTSNNASITFPPPTANWGLITSFGIFDASTAGNLLIFGPLTTSKTVNSGDAPPQFITSALTFQIDNS